MHSTCLACDGDFDSLFVQLRRNARYNKSNLWAKTPLHTLCSEHGRMVRRGTPNILRVHKTAFRVVLHSLDILGRHVHTESNIPHIELQVLRMAHLDCQHHNSDIKRGISSHDVYNQEAHC